jgi:hypothetical protein
MSTRKVANGSGGLKPWHIGLFVVALVLGIWQLTKTAVESRAASDAKVVKPTEPPKMPEKASPGTQKMFRDKDADSND